MEHLFQDLLHLLVALRDLRNGAGICAHTGEGEGLEIGRRVFGWKCGAGSACHVGFQKEE
jgi:hypothetical protein